MELDTARFYWQTVEQQTPQLIDGTYQRLFDELRAGVDEEDEADLAVYLRDTAEEGVRQTARTTALLQAWIIFEEIALWASDELRRQGRQSSVVRSDEMLPRWAARVIAAQTGEQRHTVLFDRLDALRRLRNILVHTNSYYDRMKPHDQTWLRRRFAVNDGVRVEEGRLRVDAPFVQAAFDDVFSAIVVLHVLFTRS